MMLSIRHAWIPALAARWLAGARTAGALTPQIKDEAGLFKPATVQKADPELRDLQRRYHCSVLVETVATFPDEKSRPPLPLPGLRTPSDESVTRWAKERAQAAGEYDVYLLICKEPLRVRVVARGE